MIVPTYGFGGRSTAGWGCTPLLFRWDAAMVRGSRAQAPVPLAVDLRREVAHEVELEAAQSGQARRKWEDPDEVSPVRPSLGGLRLLTEICALAEYAWPRGCQVQQPPPEQEVEREPAVEGQDQMQPIGQLGRVIWAIAAMRVGKTSFRPEGCRQLSQFGKTSS